MFLDGKKVNCIRLRAALEDKFSNDNYDYEYKHEIEERVDEFIQDNVEKPAFMNAVEEKGEEATDDIYEIIDNVDEFRDCVSDFIRELEDEIF